MNPIKRYWNYLKTREQHRKIIKELNQLTDRQLRDMGIYRGDIDNLVWLDEDKQKRGSSY